MKRERYDCAAGCSVEKTLQLISGKWKSVILYQLIAKKVCRFGELQRLMPNCSRRMLALQLSQLEQDELITKRIFPVVPPKTEYRLSPLGATLEPLIQEMATWGTMYNQLKKPEGTLSGE